MTWRRMWHQTCHKALQVVLTLKEYVGAINNPFGHKLEVMLNSFGWTT